MATLASISYAPFAGSANPGQAASDEPAQIRADLEASSRRSPARSASIPRPAASELVPEIAAEFGLNVTVGAWIDKHAERNEREIRSAIDLARRHSNVNSVWSATKPSTAAIRRRRAHQDDPAGQARDLGAGHRPAKSGTSGSTHPELASAVDYIAAHVLPYWEGVSETSRGRPGHPASTTSCARPIPASASSSPNSAGRAPAIT